MFETPSKAFLQTLELMDRIIGQLGCREKILDRARSLGWKHMLWDRSPFWYRVEGADFRVARRCASWFREVELFIIAKELLLVEDPERQKIIFEKIMVALTKSEKAREYFKDLIRAGKGYSLLGQNEDDFNDDMPV